MTDDLLLKAVGVYRAQQKLDRWLGLEVLQRYNDRQLTRLRQSEIAAYCERRLLEESNPQLDSFPVSVRVFLHGAKIELEAFHADVDEWIKTTEAPSAPSDLINAALEEK